MTNRLRSVRETIIPILEPIGTAHSNFGWGRFELGMQCIREPVRSCAALEKPCQPP